MKAANPATHVWVYRQLVKALPWYRGRRREDGGSQAGIALDVKRNSHTALYISLVIIYIKYTGRRQHYFNVLYTYPGTRAGFLPFRKGGASDLRNGCWHVPPCTSGLCSNLYHSQDQVQLDSCNGTCDCSGVPCGEYLWDHRKREPARLDRPTST